MTTGTWSEVSPSCEGIIVNFIVKVMLSFILMARNILH